MSVELAAGTVNGVAKLLLGWLVKRWGYAKNLPEHAEELGKLVDSLMQLKMDVEKEVERAKHHWNLPTNEVLGWIKDADLAIAKGHKYMEQYNKGRGGKDFSRMFVLSSYKLGKQMMRLSTAIKELRKGGNFSKFAVEDVPELVQKVPGGNIVGIEDNQAGASTSSSTNEGSSVEQKLNEIWQCILDPYIMRIGIWGKGGIGKTTIIRNIINTKLQRTTHFDVVIFVVVSSDMNTRKLRFSIAKELQLDLSGEEDNNRAAHLLFSKLMGMKFFLIFDDVWERIDLEVLGVPIPTNKNGCKVLLTTRKIVVCRLMETDKEFHMSDLPKNEAWKLFSEKAGGITSPSIESTAKLVCEECHGLPLALIVVGRALRKENDVGLWEHALNALRSSQFELEGMEKDVFSPLKFSYDYLKNDTLRNCFLYCAIFPEDYDIHPNDLIKYWITEGLVDMHQGFSLALDKARHVILKELIDCCLLERFEDDEVIIHMHDVIRDMAIKITSEKGRRFLVNAQKGFDEWLGADDLNEVHKINLMDNDIKTLPDAPHCPKLSTLLLHENFFLEHIPDSFFRSMITLRVLNLSNTGIKSLPQSFSGLVNLQGLILRSCYSLSDITHIGSLRNLLLLDLFQTYITELPDVVGELNCLRVLDLSDTSQLERISTGTISKLTNLEFLDMQHSAFFRGGVWKEGVIHDIGCLKNLHHLSLDVSSDDNGLCFIFSKLEKLVSFYIRFGPDNSRTIRTFAQDNRGEFSKTRRCLQLGQIINFELASYADELVLQDMNMLDSVCSLGVHNLENLKKLSVFGCESISKAIIHDEEQVILPYLELLRLFDVLNLPCVWEVKGDVGTFRSIKLIELHKCTSARYVFSIDVISELGCLEQLIIVDCKNMEQIVSGVVNQTKKITRLENLELYGLRSLRGLWEQQVFLPALTKIKVLDCENLKHLPLSLEIAPALGCIEGYQEWWNDLTWTCEAARSYLQELFKQPLSNPERSYSQKHNLLDGFNQLV